MNHAQTFFFYDLETSGIDPRRQRIMQFAGIRTDANLQQIGEPINVLIALSDDVLPDPRAIMITGITPQKTLEEGYNERDFLRLLHEQVFLPGTVITGFNSVRFDDEFMRYTLYRNFHDPYEWQWQDGRSRWDLLDVIRMTRALRPDGIEWPFTEEGHATNRLELLTKTNNLDHANAHDALSDVQALIDIAKMLKAKQPKLFDYLLKLRSKQEVAKLVNLDDPQPFVYTSGRYSKDILHTTVAYPLAPGGKPGSAIVYDLRYDPTDWAKRSVQELKDIRFSNYEQRRIEGFVPLPAKELSYNRCPAVAPMGVLDKPAQDRLKIDMVLIEQNLKKLQSSDLGDKLREVFARDTFPRSADVDGQLYDGFIGDKDKSHMRALQAATGDDLADFRPPFGDERLQQLITRYKARNYPKSLNASEREEWEAYRTARLQADLPKFMKNLGLVAKDAKKDNHQFLLSELQLWAESIAPIAD